MSEFKETRGKFYERQNATLEVRHEAASGSQLDLVSTPTTGGKDWRIFVKKPKEDPRLVLRYASEQVTRWCFAHLVKTVSDFSTIERVYYDGRDVRIDLETIVQVPEDIRDAR